MDANTMTGAVTGAIVQVFVQQLLTYIGKEGDYILGFKNRFREMSTQLNYMQSFLTDANKFKVKAETVKTTLVKLRELIYDAEDILIDCQIRVDNRKQAAFCFSALPDLFFHYKTGKALSGINDRIVKMKENLTSYVNPIANVGHSSHGENNNKDRRWTSHVFDQSQIVGLTDDMNSIKGWILPTNEALHRVGIVGMGGLGKTTITQKIFNDRQVINRFEKRIWVSVTQTVSETDIMRGILKELKEDENGSQGNLLHKIQQALLNKTYLIVMDDVWSTDNWWEQISIGLPKRIELSSCIIITTRDEGVAKSMGVEETRIHRPKVLEKDDSWSLFCKIAFSTKKCKMTPQLEKVGKEIVEKCRGLPLAIKTIGGLLSAKTTSVAEWQRISNHFHDELATKETNNSVIASLRLSYEELPAHLKHCLLCFSIYPEDYEISVEQLVYWWVGEGFVYGKYSKTAIEMAFDYLDELISRCLVEVVQRRGYDGRVYICKMHDLVRDLTIRIAIEEVFCSFDIDNNGRQTPRADSRHLGFTCERDVQPLGSNSKLRALLLVSSSPFHLNQNKGLAKVKSLRVLDLSNNKLEDSHIENLQCWISYLKRLAYLNLQGIAVLKELGQSIEKLLNLQVLVLADCNNLEKLPPSITSLQRLMVLDIRNCQSLCYLPKGLEKLSNLQELSGFKLVSPGIKDACHFGELKSLTQLKVLRINISEEGEIVGNEKETLSHLEKLQVLSIDTEYCQNKEILQKLDDLSPPKNILELYLRYYHGEISPKWITPTSLLKLQYLFIENGELTQMSDGFWDGATWNVEGLCLKFLPRLEMEWATVQSKMPYLRYLEVSHCYKLKEFPCNVMNLGYWRKKEEEDPEGSEMEKK